MTVINLDADLPVGPDAGPVDVEHIGVGLGDRLLHQVPMPNIDLLF